MPKAHRRDNDASAIEPSAKRQRTGDEMQDDDPASDQFDVTPKMKADMLEELASLSYQPSLEEHIDESESDSYESEGEEEEEENTKQGDEGNMNVVSASDKLESSATKVIARKNGADLGKEPEQDALDEDYVPGEGVDTPNIAPVATPVTDVKKGGKKKKRKKKQGGYNPRMWPEGGQDPLNLRAAKKLVATKGVICCLDTGVELDLNEKNTMGSLWQEMRSHAFFDMRDGISASVDQREVLKACVRLGRMIEPERLSVLLGGKSRNSEYCEFILTAFLGLFNVRKTRQILGGDQKSGKEEPHGEILVYADMMYPSDDELLNSSEKDAQRSRDEAEKHTSVNPISRLTDGAPEDDECDELNNELPFQRLQFDQVDDEGFANALSYVTRTYLSNIVARPIRRFGEFFLHCGRLGIAFEAATASVLSRHTRGKGLKTKSAENRLKWLVEPMPAPEIGENKTVKLGTIDLWRHASKYFSVQQLARIALIQYDRLLDWLCLVAFDSEVSKSDAEYNRDRNMVVSVAPVPLLYLADCAAELAMEVLGVAVHTAKNMPLTGDKIGDGQRIITADDVRYAAGWVMGVEEKQRVAYEVFSEPFAGSGGMMGPGSWPHLLQRPLSISEEFIICDRVPANKISVPVNDVHEAKAVLDSFKEPARRVLYTSPNSIMLKDPLWTMTGSDKNRVREERIAWRKKHGLVEFLRGSSAKVKKVVPRTDVGVASAHAAESKDKAKAVSREEDDDVEKVAESTVISSPVPDEDNGLTWTAESYRSMEDLNTKERTTSHAISNLLGVEVDFDDEYLSEVNAAERVCQQIGHKELRSRRKAANALSAEQEAELKGIDGDNLNEFLKLSKNWQSIPPCAISYHRLAWICLRALGDNVDTGNLDEKHLLGYGSTANYTNFGEFGTSEAVSIDTSGLDCLIQLVDQRVRMEAETLMACAAHDDGRPWIDRADVVLVTSLRKQEYRYGDIGI